MTGYAAINLARTLALLDCGAEARGWIDRAVQVARETAEPRLRRYAALYAAQLAIDRKQDIVVGVNQFVEEEVQVEGLLRVDPALEAEQVGRLKAFRSGRDERVARDHLDALQQAAAGADNLLPPILAAVEAKASLGEVADALRAVFGEYQESVIL